MEQKWTEKKRIITMSTKNEQSRDIFVFFVLLVTFYNS